MRKFIAAGWALVGVVALAGIIAAALVWRGSGSKDLQQVLATMASLNLDRRVERGQSVFSY